MASVVDTRVRLQCESDGLPKPIVRWEKNGEPFPTTGLRHTMLDKGSLEFVSVQLEDTGDYRCYASNPAGQATQNVKLSVQGELEKNKNGRQKYEKRNLITFELNIFLFA